MSIYVTITGQKHYFGILPFSIGTQLTLIPDKESAYDTFAICAMHALYGKVGYVANHKETIAGGTSSAEAIYALVKNRTSAIVRFIAGDYILCELLL